MSVYPVGFITGRVGTGFSLEITEGDESLELLSFAQLDMCVQKQYHFTMSANYDARQLQFISIKEYILLMCLKKVLICVLFYLSTVPC